MKPQDIVVRPATQEDAPLIHDITQEAFTTYSQVIGRPVAALTEDVEDVKRDIREKQVYIASAGGEVLGTARVYAVGRAAHFCRFGVRTAVRGGGIGGALLKRVEQWAREHGLEAIVLYTASTNLSLMRFYYGKGFYVHSTDSSPGYIRALLIKPLNGREWQPQPGDLQ
nr:GNAT family N-acetyltransferase [bacterium]